MKVRKEKMWEQYYQLRSTNEFAHNWEAFLKQSGAVPSQTLYQHVTDIVFNHSIKELYYCTIKTYTVYMHTNIMKGTHYATFQDIYRDTFTAD